MMGVKLVGSRDFDQLFAAWKFMRQQMKEIETANHETRDQAANRNAEQQKQDPKQSPRVRRAREQIEPKGNQGRGDGDQRDQSDEAIENNGEQRPGLFSAGFFEQQITLNNIAACPAGKKFGCKTFRS